MIPFLADQPLGYPSPVFNWQNFDVEPSKYFTYFDPNKVVSPNNNLENQILRKDNGNNGSNYEFIPYPVSFSHNWYQYDDINSDPDLRNRVVRKYKDFILDWLNDSFSDLLNYFVVRKKDGNDVVEFNKDAKENQENKDSNDVKSKKIEYIKHNILHKRTIAKWLELYTVNHNLKWWDLSANRSIVKNYIYKKLHKKISQDN